MSEWEPNPFQSFTKSPGFIGVSTTKGGKCRIYLSSRVPLPEDRRYLHSQERSRDRFPFPQGSQEYIHEQNHQVSHHHHTTVGIHITLITSKCSWGSYGGTRCIMISPVFHMIRKCGRGSRGSPGRTIPLKSLTRSHWDSHSS